MRLGPAGARLGNALRLMGAVATLVLGAQLVTFSSWRLLLIAIAVVALGIVWLAWTCSAARKRGAAAGARSSGWV